MKATRIEKMINEGISDLHSIDNELVDAIIRSQLMGFVGPGSPDNRMIQKLWLQKVVAVAFATGLAAGRGAK